MLEEVVAVVTLLFTLPVLASSYYSMILLLSSFRYPRSERSKKEPSRFPVVSILIATFNEKFVISKTLGAVATLSYPKEKLKVIVADDSTDETVEIIHREVERLRDSGIDATISRREKRLGFKSGALNAAARVVKGEYVLLLDADSIVTPEVLTRGLAAFEENPNLGFVSFRVGHYNREQSIITRIFALSLDLGDTLNKMGAYSINSPFSFQGGFTLISAEALRSVGYWSGDSIVEDADLSCKIYTAGRKGIYLSDVRIFGEDVQTLETWKRQAARVSQGWAKCVSTHWRKILDTPHLSRWRKMALLLFLLTPFASLSWIVVSFSAALAVFLGVNSASQSIFSMYWYVILVSVPISSFFISAVYSLWVQRIATVRNLLLIPLLSYTGYCMLTVSSVGFLNGLRGRSGSFFRTPKSGEGRSADESEYFQGLTFERTTTIEIMLSIAALALSLSMFVDGAWFLALTLLGFGLLTLKSLQLSRLLNR